MKKMMKKALIDSIFFAVALPLVEKTAKRAYQKGLVDGGKVCADQFIQGGFIPTAQLVSDPEQLRDIERLLSASSVSAGDRLSRLGAQRINELVCRVRAQRLVMEQTNIREKTV